MRGCFTAASGIGVFVLAVRARGGARGSYHVRAGAGWHIHCGVGSRAGGVRTARSGCCKRGQKKVQVPTQ